MKFPLFIFFISLTCHSIEKIQIHGQKLKQPQLSDHHFVSQFDQDQLNHYQHIEELIQHTPGVTSAGGSNRARFYQIRGIGERSSYEGMPNESVNLFLDEIDYTGFGSVLNTAGIEQVQIYKGPQNTSSGAASLGGSIHAKSMAPKENASLGKFQISSFETQELGLTQSLFNINSLTLNYHKSDGYFQNKFLKRNDTNGREEFTLKNQFKLKNMQWNLHFFDFNSGYDVFNLENNKETYSDNPGQDNQRSLATSLIVDKRFLWGELKSIATALAHDSFYSYDEDWEYTDSYDYRIEFTKQMKSFSLEERLSWQRALLSHRTGLYFKNDHQTSLEHAYNGLLPRKNLYASYQRRRAALFHESEYEASNALTFFSGARLTHFSSSYSDNNGVHASPGETLWGAQVGVKSYGDDSLWSIRLAKGFKAGGINIGTNIDASRRNFDDESLYTLDFLYQYYDGFKAFDINAFYAYRQEIQVKTSFQDDPGDPSSFTFYNDNATSGKAYGLEWSMHWEPTNIYQVFFQGLLMQTAYGNYQYGTRNLKEREFAYAPNYKLSLTQQFKLAADLNFETKHTATDEFYFGNSHNESAPKAIVTDLSLSWKWLKLWSKNVFNARSELRGFYFGNRPPNYTDERFVQVGPPRTIGVSGQFAF